MGYTIGIGEHVYKNYDTEEILSPEEYGKLPEAKKFDEISLYGNVVSFDEYQRLSVSLRGKCEMSNAFSEYAVKHEYHEESPHYDEPTDGTNERWPSYSSWSNFVKFVGLEDLFFNNKDGLMMHHPGVSKLKKKHKKAIDAAYSEFKKKYPNAFAGYSPKINVSEGVFEDETWPMENNWLVRLEWLKYWVDWSLENCENPVIVNT